MLSIGLDSKLIESLVEKGYTLSKLQSLSPDSLTALGLNESQIQYLFDRNRPAIPLDILMQVLYASKWCCCVCRNPKKGVVIHHLEEWHISHSHSENNLVVLCPDHHNEAHTKRSLSLNLDKKKLIEFKQRWLTQVQNDDRAVIIRIISDPDVAWDYFNHNRLFDLCAKYKINWEEASYATYLKQFGVIDGSGRFEITDNPDQTQFYKFKDSCRLRVYMSDLIQSLLVNLPFIDITDKFTKTKIKSLVTIGNHIAIQAAFYFKQISKTREGINQLRYGYYKKGNVVIKFVINPYECTSDSSNFMHIAGHKVATVIGTVKSITNEDGVLVITISCLMIGCYMQKHDFYSIKKIGNYVLLKDQDDYIDDWGICESDKKERIKINYDDFD